MTSEKKKLPLWAVILLCILGAAVLCVGIFALVIWNDPGSAFEAPAGEPHATPAPAQRPQGGAAVPSVPATPTPSPDPAAENEANADRDFMHRQARILLVGWDESPERNDADSALYRDANNNFRSDVLMVLTVDFDTGSASLLSVPRDTYAPIYNTEGRWKINAAFAKGGSAKGDGFRYAKETVGDLLGIDIPYHIGVDMQSLKALVDALGGVDYDVDVEIHLNGRTLEKGPQHLNGQQVLDYCRARKGISTDVGRNDRQQRMLTALFTQLKDSGKVSTLPKLYQAMQDQIHTDLSFPQISSLAVFALKMDMNDLTRHTLSGEYMNAYNAAFYVLDQEKLSRLVQELYGVTPPPHPRYDIHYVKADMAAREAQKLIADTDYLLTLLPEQAQAVPAAPDINAAAAAAVLNPAGLPPVQPPADPLREQTTALLSRLREISTRTVPENADEATVNAALDQSLDETAIRETADALQQSVLTLCAARQVTRSQADRSLCPTLYKLLPEDPPIETESGD